LRASGDEVSGGAGPALALFLAATFRVVISDLAGVQVSLTDSIVAARGLVPTAARLLFLLTIAASGAALLLTIASSRAALLLPVAALAAALLLARLAALLLARFAALIVVTLIAHGHTSIGWFRYRLILGTVIFDRDGCQTPNHVGCVLRQGDDCG
jgi:hypothetical protein